MINVAITTVKEEGVLSLWKGLKPALLRQFLYSGLRMGMYEPIRNAFGSGGLASKIGAGVVSGGIAAAIFTPTDLLKIRMQGSSGQKYRGLFHAFRTVVQEEGILGLWKGVVPTSQRAAVVAAAELASYDQCKQFIIGNGWLDDNAIAHFAASFMAGFVATSCSSPIDVVKTRIMNQPIDSTGRGLYYKSSVDCVRKMIRSEGIGSFYRGFFPNWIRLGPWCVVMFMTYEQLKRLITV
jgi:solute carrier family 25 uncoupling protein 27